MVSLGFVLYVWWLKLDSYVWDTWYLFVIFICVDYVFQVLQYDNKLDLNWIELNLIWIELIMYALVPRWKSNGIQNIYVEAHILVQEWL